MSEGFSSFSHTRWAGNPGPLVASALSRHVAPSIFQPLRLKSFIYRKWTRTVFRNALIYRLETSARLCNCLIARVRTGLHVYKKIFPNSPVRFLCPQSPTSRETHASHDIFVGVLDRFPLVTEPAWYRVILHCTAKINFFPQSTFGPLCRTLAGLIGSDSNSVVGWPQRPNCAKLMGEEQG